MHNFLRILREGGIYLKFEIEQLRREPFIVYGGGSGFDTFNTFILSKYNLKPYAVIDEKYSEELNLEGVLFISPEMLRAKSDLLNTLVIVSIGKKEVLEQVSINLKLRIC